MTEPGSSALYTALAYHRAWTSHDFDQAMAHIAPDIVCRAASGPVIGVDAFRAFLGLFSERLIRSELIAAFGGPRTAVLIYNAESVAVKNIPAAEYVTVDNDLIVQMTIIFDRAPFDAARRTE